MILEELNEYKSPKDKLSRLVKAGVYIPIIKGFYETNENTSKHLLANLICSPSYISFEFALSYYDFIPERVEVVTSASFNKRRKKIYSNHFGIYTYKDIPIKAFPYSIKIMQENDYYFKIASPEKAICDKLYDEKPVSNQKQLLELLEDDLRIDMDLVAQLDKELINELSLLYKSTNVKRFAKLLGRISDE